MNRTTLSDSQVENLLLLVEELQMKLKKKNEQLTLARQRLANAKRSIQRLQNVTAFQRERIMDLHREELLGVKRSPDPKIELLLTSESELTGHLKIPGLVSATKLCNFDLD